MQSHFQANQRGAKGLHQRKRETPSKRPVLPSAQLPKYEEQYEHIETRRNQQCIRRAEDLISSSEEDTNVPLPAKPALDRFLHYPSPPLLKSQKSDIGAARVLTGLENLKLLEDKQRAKEEKQRAKEERQTAKKEKQRAKQNAKEDKQKALEERKKVQIEADKSKWGKRPAKSKNSGKILT